MTGRNENCPCGSGKKYKNCHFRIQLGDRSAASSDPELLAKTIELALSQGDRPTRDQALSRLLQVSPNHPRTLYYQALCLQLEGELETALRFYTAAARQQFPSYSTATLNVMAASKAIDTAMGKYPGSQSTGWESLLGHPTEVAALEKSLGRWDIQQSASKDSERMIAANAWFKLAAISRQGLVDAEKCQHYCKKVLQLNPDHQLARSTLLFTLNYDTVKSPVEIHALHVSAGDWWGSRFPERQRAFLNPRQADKVLRVGYLSTDFRHHPVAYFIIPVLRHHDPVCVQSFVYHGHSTSDEYTHQAAQLAHRFLNCTDLDDQALARQIEQDGIDILIDLNGTSGQGRQALLAQRAAPIQMTWLGSPNSTGLPTMDYRIVDKDTDPPPHAQSWNREQLLYLPRQFSVYSPLGDLPPVVLAPSSESGHVTYGSFNNITKINRPLLRCWAGILMQVPNSRLVLKYPTLDYAPLRQQLSGLLADEGIEPSRVTLHGNISDRYQHLASYALIDIQLDTFPYNGTTTSCESLLMGVPVISRAGNDHRSRVGASLLASVGKNQWICQSDEEYQEVSVRLGSDLAALAQIRATLRSQVQASSLMDAAGFTRELENAYRSCWKLWCQRPN